MFFRSGSDLVLNRVYTVLTSHAGLLWESGDDDGPNKGKSIFSLFFLLNNFSRSSKLLKILVSKLPRVCLLEDRMSFLNFETILQ